MLWRPSFVCFPAAVTCLPRLSSPPPPDLQNPPHRRRGRASVRRRRRTNGPGVTSPTFVYTRAQKRGRNGQVSAGPGPHLQLTLDRVLSLRGQTTTLTDAFGTFESENGSVLVVFEHKCRRRERPHCPDIKDHRISLFPSLFNFKNTTGQTSPCCFYVWTISFKLEIAISQLKDLGSG